MAQEEWGRIEPMVKLQLDINADSRYSFDRKRVRTALAKALAEQGLEGNIKISLSVVGERKIKELEKKYFNRDEVTDVLSFPMDVESTPLRSSTNYAGQVPEDFDGQSLGDIVICYPQAKRQAMQWNRIVDEELEFLACHGLLHLLGIHHD